MDENNSKNNGQNVLIPDNKVQNFLIVKDGLKNSQKSSSI